VAGKHEPPTRRSFYLSVTTTTIRAIVLAAAVVIGAVVLSKGFASDASQSFTPQPTQTTPSASGTPSGTPSPSSHPTTPASPPVKGVTVQVLNGTHTANLASNTKTQLEQAGYTVTGTGNSATAYQTTTIYYASGSKAAADYMKSAFFPGASVKPTTASIGSGSKLTVILGSDFAATK
jgi:hypothetical protein